MDFKMFIKYGLLLESIAKDIKDIKNDIQEIKKNGKTNFK